MATQRQEVEAGVFLLCTDARQPALNDSEVAEMWPHLKAFMVLLENAEARISCEAAEAKDGDGDNQN